MERVRKTVLTLLVWLTAAMTLVAGTPHFRCLCPNGQVKHFCSGSASKQTCCCSGNCCGSSEGGCSKSAISSGKGKKSVCCGPHGREQVRSERTSGWSIENKCCSRSLAPSEFFSVSGCKSSGVKEVSARLPLAHRAVLVPFASATERCPISWQNHRIPPPTDLVITLQHLTI